MKANELRIGNYIQHGNYIATVGPAFFTSYDNYDFEKDGIFKPEIKPILLTEEWLLKFGFEKLGGYLWDCKKLGNKRFINNPYGVTHFEMEFGNHYIQYIHQLQNLYFALTGEELTTITE